LELKQSSTSGLLLGVKFHKIEFLSFQYGFESYADAEPDAESNADLFLAIFIQHFLTTFSSIFVKKLNFKPFVALTATIIYTWRSPPRVDVSTSKLFES